MIKQRQILPGSSPAPSALCPQPNYFLPCLAWPQGLLEETADQPLAGNQLVAVLRQLQGMVKRCACACPPAGF